MSFKIHELDEILSSVSCTDECKIEIAEKFLSVSDKKAFLNLLNARIALLEQLREQAINTSNFEKLKGCTDLYSMKLKGKTLNFRILYALNAHNEILLLAFDEKQGKRKTEYSNYTTTAKNRLKEWRNENV